MPFEALLSVLDFGATGDGRQDETAAIQRTLDAAGRQGRGVRIPAGVYRHAGPLEIRGVAVRGDGERTVLVATVPDNAMIHLTGRAPALSDLRIANPASTRATTRAKTGESAGIHVEKASGFTIRHVHIDGAASAGILVRLSSDGHILDNTVSGTLADAIHITRASHDIVVRGNTVSDAGDDGIACVSYSGQEGPVKTIAITGNTVTDNAWGRNIAVVGGQSITIAGNTIDGNKAGLAGLYIAGEASYHTLGVSDVLATGNTIAHTGSRASGHGQVTVTNTSDQLNTGTGTGTGAGVDVTIAGNTIVASPYRAIVVRGRGNASVLINDNLVRDSDGDAIVVADGVGHAALVNNRIENAGDAGAAGDSLAGSTLLIVNNVFAGRLGGPAVALRGPPLALLEVAGNSRTTGEAEADTLQIDNRTGTTPTLDGDLPGPGHHHLTTTTGTPLDLAASQLLAGPDRTGPDRTRSRERALVAAGRARHASVTVANGRILVEPEPGYAGPAGFDYVVSDGRVLGYGRVDVEISGPSPWPGHTNGVVSR
jgi:parallel beta-helix repeat protein